MLQIYLPLKILETAFLFTSDRCGKHYTAGEGCLLFRCPHMDSFGGTCAETPASRVCLSTRAQSHAGAHLRSYCDHMFCERESSNWSVLPHHLHVLQLLIFLQPNFARLSVQCPSRLTSSVDFHWKRGCVQLEASVSSDLDLFYSWQGGRCVLRCVNRLANCACPLTETVIACVLEYFAWRTGGSALEPVQLWWGVLNTSKIFFLLVWFQWSLWRVCHWHNTRLLKWPSWQLDLHVI